ncbi:MAG: hypothetical protein MRZ79_16205 [Bacteroidia bacterium]|nr:hypothetical protein [Bacteroidia bacterium]
MFGKATYDSLQRAKAQLAKDDLSGCISTLLTLTAEIGGPPLKGNGIGNAGGGEFESKLIVYSAALQRAQSAYEVGLIDYDKNSIERSKIIKGILSNIHGYVQSGKGMFTDPTRSEMIYSVHIEDEQLLSEQLNQLADSLEASN